MSTLEAAFDTLWRTLAPDALAPVSEFRFTAEAVGRGRSLRARLAAAGLRDWRLDRAWPQYRVAVELEGGTWGGHGRHVRGQGYADDCQKYNAAVALGWRVFRATSDMLRDDPAAFVAQVRAAIEEE